MQHQKSIRRNKLLIERRENDLMMMMYRNILTREMDIRMNVD